MVAEWGQMDSWMVDKLAMNAAVMRADVLVDAKVLT